MKVVITGGGGMLAQALDAEFRSRRREVVAIPRAELDVTREAAVVDRVRTERPAVVVQCAAFTDVDGAEGDPEGAHRVNADGARHVARACQITGALFVYPSTDYVFSGRASRPWRPEDAPDPVNVYGRSKLAGERVAEAAGRWLIVRTSWLYGRGGRNFVDTISDLARTRDSLEVVDDQIGVPTCAGSLARSIADLIDSGATGTFHATDRGDPVSWCGFAREILDFQGLVTPVRPVSSDALGRPAPRPRYSVLDCSATEDRLGRPLPDWRKTLQRYLSGSSRFVEYAERPG